MSKLCLLLPNISHASIEAWGNIPHLAEKQGYTCKLHDWPKKGFEEGEQIEEITDLIKQHEHVVIISNSFGDLIARKILRQNNTNIVAHISVCGFGSRKYLSVSSKILLYLAAYIWQFFYKNKSLVKRIAKLFNRPLSPYATRKAHKIHTAAAVLGLKKGLKDRALYALKYKEDKTKITTPVYILFSENDNNFSPLKNAEYIAAEYEKAALFTLENAGHGSFLEMPEKYDPVIKDILGRSVRE